MCDCSKPTPSTSRKRFVLLTQQYPNKQYPNEKPAISVWNPTPFATQNEALDAAGKAVTSSPAVILLVAEVTHEVTIGVANVTKLATE
jgi:hypothetical protein